MRFLLRVIINGIALWLTTVFISGITVDQESGTMEWFLTYLGLGLIFGLVNAIVKPIVKIISLPLYILTLGLFTFVVNAAMLGLTSWLSSYTPFALHVDGFWSAVWGAVIISIVSFLLSLVTPGDE